LAEQFNLLQQPEGWGGSLHPGAIKRPQSKHSKQSSVADSEIVNRPKHVEPPPQIRMMLTSVNESIGKAGNRENSIGEGIFAQLSERKSSRNDRPGSSTKNSRPQPVLMTS